MPSSVAGGALGKVANKAGSKIGKITRLKICQRCAPKLAAASSSSGSSSGSGKSADADLSSGQVASAGGTGGIVKGKTPWPAKGKVVVRYAPGASPPVRGIGLAHAAVDPGDRKLAASIEAPAETRPRGVIPVTLKVDGAGGGVAELHAQEALPLARGEAAVDDARVPHHGSGRPLRDNLEVGQPYRGRR